MDDKKTTRAIAAAAVAALGVAAAWWAGATPAGALLALLAGIVAFALLRAPAPAAAAEAAPQVEAHLPEGPDLLAAFGEPLLVVRDRRVLIANEAARALLGDHIEGSDVRLAIRHPAAAEPLAGEGGAAPARIELVGLGEVGRPWEMAVAPLPDGSRLVRLADQSQARAAEQMRVDFVANASHELRTPLATLLGFIETLQDEEAVDPETRQRFVAIMFGEATRMRDLLDDLMSLSRIEAERFALPRDTVDLTPLIEEVKAALKPLAKGRALRVESELGGEEALVGGDRVQLGQMVGNLVVNAIKYGRPGTPIRIRLDEAAPDLVRLSVVDQGDGIAADHIPRLTERFYRVDPGRSRSVGGTGLGLAIVKHIVLRHRGRLDIASEPGEGTTVSVCLPRA
ncbi:MAG: two-component system, OmpR family, phosphate regulon sensor histidine kinase PhoR [Sphingomonadales bacterium]|jgi:two-component system phosphate regulon sensor histidine kinase PhoR|nr:two-component system, OmpR family, phosphate regulon sensor histidine kinase PhoR [Sphingomonadales bacterium]